MSVTSSSAKVKYFVGSFDYSTGLTLPATSQKNTLTLDFQEDIGDQLTDFGDSSGDEIFVLLKVTLDGTEVYVNDDFDSPPTGTEPTNPDLTVGIFGVFPATFELTTVNNYIPMTTTSDGVTSTGQYVVEAKFVYLDDTTSGDYIFEEGTFTSNYSYSEVEPDLGYYYDTLVPRLNVSDNTNYTFEGSLPDRDTEFVLYPPQNRAKQTNTLTDIQSVNYSTFYSGGNEVRYTVLMEYEFVNEIIVNAQQEYESFTVYRVDRCKLYDCLNEQYNRYVSSTCSGSLRQQREDNFNKANGLALQILTGQSCNKESLTSVIEAFNALCDCDCDCLDETPTLIQPAAENDANTIQAITADTSDTDVDLSAGRTVIITIESDTTLDISNINQYVNYRIILVADAGGEKVSFDATVFEDQDGDIETVELDVDGVLIMDFYTFKSNILTLVSRSDSEKDTIQVVSATTASTSIDLDEGNICDVSLAAAGGTTEVSVSNIVENRYYTFIFGRSFASQEATFSADFNGPDGTVASVTPLLDDDVIVVFRALTDSLLTLVSRSDTGIDLTAGTGIDVSGDTISLDSATQASLLLADTSLQPNDNISELVNDENYIASNVQEIGDVVANFSIDWSLGEVASFTLDAASVSVTSQNEEPEKVYRSVVRCGNSGGSVLIFQSSEFILTPITLQMEFGDYAVLTWVCKVVGGLNRLFLQSVERSYQNPLLLNVVNDASASTTADIDFTRQTQMYTFDMDSSDLTISSSNSSDIEDGKVYMFLVKATGANRTITFSTGFRDQTFGGFNRTVTDGESAIFTFVGTTDFINTSTCILTSEVS